MTPIVTVHAHHLSHKRDALGQEQWEIAAIARGVEEALTDGEFDDALVQGRRSAKRTVIGQVSRHGTTHQQQQALQGIGAKVVPGTSDLVGVEGAPHDPRHQFPQDLIRCNDPERLQLFCQVVREVSVEVLRRKPMHQDDLWLFRTDEEQEVLRLVNLVPPFGETRFERGALDAVAIHHNHIANADPPLLDQDHSNLLHRHLSVWLLIDHTAILPRARYAWPGRPCSKQ